MEGWAVALGALAAGALLLVAARRALFVVHVDGTSMAPTFRPGEAVLAVRRLRRLPVRRQGIVVCRLPAGTPGPDSLLIKRVVAIAGDDLPLGDGVVPSGRVFVRGDGPSSYDSRQFGPIPTASVVGHVLARLSLGKA